jgi:hypothetical protein
MERKRLLGCRTEDNIKMDIRKIWTGSNGGLL